MSYLLCIETANPAHLHQQHELEAFYNAPLQVNDSAIQRKIGAVARKSGIQQRYSVLSDFGGKNNDQHFFYSEQPQNKLPGLTERMLIFREEALKLSLKAVHAIKNFEKIRDKVTHIITVTCTGLFAPGLDIELARELGLKRTVQRSSINFMGCNAALLALKQASHITRSEPGSLVLVVCTELCTIHFQRDYSDDYILSNMLFADGSAAALVGKPSAALSLYYRPLYMGQFHSLLLHEGHKHMAWSLSEKGFIMNLSAYVSGLLNTSFHEVLDENGIRREEIKHWAIHPGGKKILDDFCTSMTLSKHELASSYHVLRNFGNMSSATILFVLKQLSSDNTVISGEQIYTAAFGPGLSVESAIMHYV